MLNATKDQLKAMPQFDYSKWFLKGPGASRAPCLLREPARSVGQAGRGKTCELEMMDRSTRVGDRVACSCGAVYELTYGDPRRRDEGDARCIFCGAPLPAGMEKLSVRVARWPERAPPV